MPQSHLQLGGIEKMIVGMTETQALRTLKINGFYGHIIKRDNTHHACTDDIDTNRFKLTIANGTVVAAIRG